jgi:putative acetyltransferase
MAAIAIERVHKATPEIEKLVDELESELAARYPPEQRHGLKIDTLFEPHIRFFVARAGSAAVGCGGVALFDGFAETKRMYVRPEFRGGGAADAIVERLFAEATAAGLDTVRLETGTEQHAAIRFYERHGFTPCGAFSPYDAMAPHQIAGSLFYEKRLVILDLIRSRGLQDKTHTVGKGGIHETESQSILGKEATQLARELGVSRQIPYAWARQADRRKGKPLTDVFPGHGKRTAEQMELDKLRRENAELREANEILKKAKAFFAKHRR